MIIVIINVNVFILLITINIISLIVLLFVVVVYYYYYYYVSTLLNMLVVINQNITNMCSKNIVFFVKKKRTFFPLFFVRVPALYNLYQVHISITWLLGCGLVQRISELVNLILKRLKTSQISSILYYQYQLTGKVLQVRITLCTSFLHQKNILYLVLR